MPVPISESFGTQLRDADASAQFVPPYRTRNRFSATSVDQLPHHLVSLWCFGHMLLSPIPDVDRTDYF